MPKLPQVTAKEIIKVFKKFGFIHKRTRGSHYIMRRLSDKRKVVVPLHGTRPLGKGLLLSLLNDADLTKEEFLKLHKKRDS